MTAPKIISILNHGAELREKATAALNFYANPGLYVDMSYTEFGIGADTGEHAKAALKLISERPHT